MGVCFKSDWGVARLHRIESSPLQVAGVAEDFTLRAEVLPWTFLILLMVPAS